jgi:hypothetical protein
MKDCEEGKYSVIFKHDNKITSKLFNEIPSVISIVDGLFLESYNDVLKITNNRWSKEIKEATIEEVAQITSPLSMVDKFLKMTFELRGMSKGNWRSNDCWTPIRLGKWLGHNISYEIMDENGNLKQNIQLNEDGLPDDISWFKKPAVSAILDEDNELDESYN